MAKKATTTRAADLARYYDLDLLDDPGDVAMYVDLAARSDGPILELAAGSGRICVPLAAAGHDVTAVDNDPGMLARARAAWEKRSDRVGTLTIIEHDLTTLRLRERFDLVIVALNSLLLLRGRAAQERALKVMRRHLAPAGRAVIDVWLPSPHDLALYDGCQVLDWVRTDHEAGERVAKSWSATYDRATQTATVTTWFEFGIDEEAGGRVERQDEIRFVGAQELLDLAGQAGLTPETIAGDYDLTSLSEASERIVLVAQATPA
jgi:SAM-dependent methyltransferase